VKDQSDRIRELERHCEALENAIEEINAATLHPSSRPALKRQIARILVAARDRKPKSEVSGSVLYAYLSEQFELNRDYLHAAQCEYGVRVC
jgi:hypothetical protein